MCANITFVILMSAFIKYRIKRNLTTVMFSLKHYCNIQSYNEYYNSILYYMHSSDIFELHCKYERMPWLMLSQNQLPFHSRLRGLHNLNTY